MFFTENILESYPSKELTWISSDPDDTCLYSIHERIKSHPNPKVQTSIQVPPPKLTLDKNGFMEEVDFEAGKTDLMICINMIHISSWEATLGLMVEASKQLKENTGRLYCYGPYLRGGKGALSNV